MGIKHTFINVSAYLNRPITHDSDENFDEVVLIPHNELYCTTKFNAAKHLAGAEVVWS